RSSTRLQTTACWSPISVTRRPVGYQSRNASAPSGCISCCCVSAGYITELVAADFFLDLVKGRERLFLEHFWQTLSPHPETFSEADRRIYTKAYAQEGANAGGV